MSQIQTNTGSLTFFKLTALVTAQLFGGLTEGHRLEKVRLCIYQDETTQLITSRVETRFYTKSFQELHYKGFEEGSGKFHHQLRAKLKETTDLVKIKYTSNEQTGK